MTLPLDAPVSELGFDRLEQSILTPAMANMTKQNLLILQGVGTRYRSKGEEAVVEIFNQQTGVGLTVGDISSLEQAGQHLNGRGHIDAASAGACCCCTCCPCCSCTASVVVKPLKAA